MLGGWFASHITQERWVRAAPLVTDLNTTATVIVESIAPGPLTSTDHVYPRTVFGSSPALARLAMNKVFWEIAAKTAATSGVPVFEVVPSYGSLSTAITTD